jgi:hypothetical protein
MPAHVSLVFRSFGGVLGCLILLWYAGAGGDLVRDLL